MKRYLVFAGDKYYASGGARDLIFSGDDHGEAVVKAEGFLEEEGYLTWAHVYDALEAKITWKGENP